MTNQEAKDLAGMLQGAFGGTWDDGRIQTWAVALRDVPFSTVVDAVRDWIKTRDRPPVPAQIRKAVRDRGPAKPSAKACPTCKGTGWAYVEVELHEGILEGTRQTAVARCDCNPIDPAAREKYDRAYPSKPPTRQAVIRRIAE